MKPTLFTACSTFSTTTNADTNVYDGTLGITNTVSGQPTLPPISREEISSLTIEKGLREMLNVLTISWTAANNTEYIFNYVSGDGSVQKTFRFITDATGSDSEIGGAIQAWAENSGVVTGTYASGSSITLTAVSGKPLFAIYGVKNITVAVATSMTVTNTGLVTPVAGNTPRVNAATHGLKRGDKVQITCAGGNWSVLDSSRRIFASSFTFVITIGTFAAGTFDLDGYSYVAATGTDAGTLTITKLPQNAFGTKAQVEASCSGFTASSTDTYDLLIIETMDSIYKVWLDAFVTSTGVVTTGYSTFLASLGAFDDGLATGSGNNDIALKQIFGLPIS